ncbi:MAG: hypothetical protein PHE47_02975 [Oscillospiraceae bacterium]|nr:hypothetical protein [Oscillospiraceae bacterium]
MKTIGAVVLTIIAWFIGLLIDVNLDWGDPMGFMCLRILFPLLVMGCCILNNGKKDKG